MSALCFACSFGLASVYKQLLLVVDRQVTSEFSMYDSDVCSGALVELAQDVA